MKSHLIPIATAVLLFVYGISAAQYAPAALDSIKAGAKAGDAMAQYQLGKIYQQGILEKQHLKRAINYYERSAVQQYDSALLALGKMHEEGIGLKKDEAVALTYYRTAARLGNPEAHYRIAYHYENGIGLPAADQALAIEHYLEALSLGVEEARVHLEKLPVKEHASASDPRYLQFAAASGMATPEEHFALGAAYERGDNIKQDIAKAFAHYSQAAEAGYPKAMTSIGLLYANGLHMQQNPRLAAKYFAMAASMNEAVAIVEAEKYDLKGLLEPSSIEYLTYMALKGDAQSQFRLYQKYYTGQGVEADFNKALDFCRMAAMQKHERAMLTLANLYYSGVGNVPANMNSAYFWYRKAAYAGVDSARFMLGEMYAEGKSGSPPNKAMAVREYLIAAIGGVEMARFRLSTYNIAEYLDKDDFFYVKYRALNGDADAQLRLGKYFLKSENNEAPVWLHKAADAGQAEAYALLGDIYQNGKCGTPVDLPQASEWFEKAAASGHIEAYRNLTIIYAKLKDTANEAFNVKALAYANKYISLIEGNPEIYADPDIFRIVGNIHLNSGDNYNAILHYTRYLQAKSPSGETDAPIAKLIEVLELRATAFLGISKHHECLTDLDVALYLLEDHFHESEVLEKNHDFLKGQLLYKKGKSFFEQKDTYKACNTFQLAKNLGTVIDEDYHETCLK